MGTRLARDKLHLPNEVYTFFALSDGCHRQKVSAVTELSRGELRYLIEIFIFY